MNRKWMAGTLAAALVVGSTSVAMASPDRSSKRQAPTAVESHEKGRSAERAQQVAALKAELAKLRDLKLQANDLRHQLNHEYSQMRRSIGQAVEAGQVDLLKQVLPELQDMRTKLQAAAEAQSEEQVETDGFEQARKTASVDLALARIQAAEERVQQRIDALQAALTAMQDLNARLAAQLPADSSQKVDEEQDEEQPEEDADEAEPVDPTQPADGSQTQTPPTDANVAPVTP